MSTGGTRKSSTRFRVLGGALFWLTAQIFGQQQESSPKAMNEDSALQFLRKQLNQSRLGADRSAKVCLAFSDLNDDGKPEAIAWILGTSFCGTGGCALRILHMTADGVAPFASIPATRPPFYRLATRSRGWHDLALLASGGGIEEGGIIAARFDGTGYYKKEHKPRPDLAGAEMMIDAKQVCKPLYTQ